MAGERVAVIGAGITGMGVARDLAMRDVPVTVFDRGHPGGGTTGASHGLLHSGARYADVDPTAARHCARERAVLGRIAGRCIRDTGGLLVALSGDDDAYVEEKLEACRACGIEVEVVPPAVAHEREPGLATGLKRVISVPDAVVSPGRLLAATTESAVGHGAELRDRTTVTDVDVRTERVRGIEIRASTGVRSIDAAHVVNATGASAGRVASLAGIDLAMAPTRGTMVAVDHGGVRHVLNRCRPPDDGDIVVPRAAEAILGTTSVPVGHADETRPTRDEVERVIAQAADMVPALGSATVTRTYAGVRPLVRGGAREASRSYRVIDHAERDGVAGFTSIVGGKLTTYRAMAEATADHVAEDLGVAARSRTADQPLPYHDDPAALDGLVTTYRTGGPADGRHDP